MTDPYAEASLVEARKFFGILIDNGTLDPSGYDVQRLAEAIKFKLTTQGTVEIVVTVVLTVPDLTLTKGEPDDVDIDDIVDDVRDSLRSVGDHTDLDVDLDDVTVV